MDRLIEGAIQSAVADIEGSDDNVDDTEPLDGIPVEGGAVEGGVDDGSGGPPDGIFYEAGAITIDLYINDVQQNPEFPIEVYNLMLTEVEFRISAEGPPLHSYEIQNAGTVNLPSRGDLEGQTAIVEYEFTYNDGFWEDWGLIIFVSNEQGDSISKSYKVVPVEISGSPTGR